MSSPGAPSSAPSRRQKRMGPAPFASFEDLSDELDSPEDKHAAGSVVRLPGIREDATPSTPAHLEQTQAEFIYAGISLVGAPVTPPLSATVGPPVTPPSTTISSLSTPQESQTSTKMSLQTPSTPRIDISRASSSSHHEDSRDSTPERELFEGHDQSGAKLGLAFKEEGTLDLRSSTEELDFQDPQEKAKVLKLRSQSPCLQEDSFYQRKDSQSSEIGLLSISGRTSRLSSIGSQGSAQSRISNVSHLSIISGQSGRSPSPHKMLLETSFCGNKPPVSSTQHAVGQSGTKVDSDVLEKVLLSRKHDPREAILAEGISMEVKPKEQALRINVPNERPVKKPDKLLANTKTDITITIDKPTSDSNNLDKPKLPKTFVSPSGVEYTYIPLKGPLPKEDPTTETGQKLKLREAKSAATTHVKSPTQSKNKEILNKSRSKSVSSSPSVQKCKTLSSTTSEKKGEPKYIRIKLKPDHMYADSQPPSSNQEVKKPICLDLNETNKKPFQSFTQVVGEAPAETVNSNIRSLENQSKHLSDTPNASPKPTRHKVLKDTTVGSTTPSPSLSRRSSFTSLFKSRETIISPESPTVPGLRRKNTLTGILKDASENLRERTRSRSKSRDRDKSSLSTAPSSTESIDSKSKQQKSVLSIFKPKKFSTKSKSGAEASSPEVLTNLEGITNVEFKFNADANMPSKKYYETPLQGESIRIPLHSPTHYDDRTLLQELKSSSQDSQETVIDTTKCVDAVVEAIPVDTESNIATQNSKSDSSKRQSSTSSENIVFSTKLGSDNDVFTTKLPKEKHVKKLLTDTKIDVSESEFAQAVPESPNDKNTCIEKCATVEEISKTIGNKTETVAASKVESLNLSKDTVQEEELSKGTLTKDLTEGAKSARHSIMSSLTNEDRYSSESERDSELDYLKSKKESEERSEAVEPERKGLVYQQDSFEDELPYIPTTLPLERSVAVPIVPVKQRGTFEMKTYPIDRPRSTTPINLSTLEDYCEDVVGAVNTENITKAIEKLKISLPRDESGDRSTKAKSPRRPATNANWFSFADKSGSQRRSPPNHEGEPTPPPLPPKGVQKEWINFEEIPERRKPPRRIQTIPSRGTLEVSESVLQENVVYSYVNPEDCKCECHELAREREQQARQQEDTVRVQEDEVPLLEEDPGDEDKSSTQELVDRIKVDIAMSDRRSVVSDSSIDLSTSLEHPETSNLDPSLRTPFTGDLGISSNRSSIVSQDEPQSPDVATPNAFPKTS